MPGSISSAQPEELFRFSALSLRIDDELSSEATRLARALERFESSCRESGFRVSVGGTDGLLRVYARDAQCVDDWVRQVGIGFQRADRGAVAESAWAELLAYLYNRAVRVDPKTFLKNILALRLLIGLRAGTTFWGEVILRDPLAQHIKFLPRSFQDIVGKPRKIRELLGLSGHLNRIRWTTIPKHMGKHAFWTTLLVEAVQLPGQWLDDIQKYEDKGINYQASAIAVDTSAAVVRAGMSAGGAYVGSWIGGIVGGAIGSVVPVLGTSVVGAAGAIVGGWIGGMVGNWAGDWVVSKYREGAIEGLAEVMSRTAEKAQEISSQARDIAADLAARTKTAVSDAAASFTAAVSPYLPPLLPDYPWRPGPAPVPRPGPLLPDYPWWSGPAPVPRPGPLPGHPWWPGPIPAPPPAPTIPTPLPSRPLPSVDALEGTETGTYNPNAPTDDCVKFVAGQPDRNVPYGFNQKEFYSGKYKGKTGALPDGTQYGQEPRLGAIMAESPNSAAGITYGHASYVHKIEHDPSGKVVGFTIAEGNWDTRPEDQRSGPIPVHTEEFHWDEGQQCFVSKSGKRTPDMFIY